MNKKISKKTQQYFSYALISLMIGFTCIYMYISGEINFSALAFAVPVFATGIYFLTTAYHRTKKELK